MTFLNLAALGALGLAVPLVLLYLLKMKRQDRVVPSTLLWARAIQDLQATHPFQKLRRSLLLILQLLLLAFLSFALARPAISSTRLDGRTVAIILDGSASMKSRDAAAGSRFEEARRLALETVEAMQRDGGEAMVVAAAHRTSVRVGLTTDRVALRRGIEELRPEDVGADLDRAVTLAAAALRGRPRPEIHLFTDGAGARLSASPGEAAIRFLRVGSSADNAAITMVDVRPAPPRRLAELKAMGRLEAGRYPFQIFAGLRNFGAAPIKAYLTLHHEDRLAGAREVGIPAGGEASVLFEDSFEPGVGRLSLDLDDVLAADNTVHFAIRAPREARVALLNPKSPFFERALRGFPYVSAVRADEAALRGEGWDLVLSEGDVPDPLPDAPFVVFRPRVPVDGIELGETQPFPDLADWSREHPVLKSVDFADVHVSEARPPASPPGRILLKGTGGSALGVLQQSPGRPFRLVFAFGLTDSDWPLRPSFPIFAWNLVQQAMEATTVVGLPQLRTGSLATLPALGSGVDIRLPSGRTMRVEPPAPDLPPAFAGTVEAGVYEADWGGERRIRFCCNLLDEHESDVKPADRIGAGGADVAAQTGRSILHRDLWPWIAVAVLLVALFEWYAFHRKVGT